MEVQQYTIGSTVLIIPSMEIRQKKCQTTKKYYVILIPLMIFI